MQVILEVKNTQGYWEGGGGGVLLGTFGTDVPAGSSNREPIEGLTVYFFNSSFEIWPLNFIPRKARRINDFHTQNRPPPSFFSCQNDKNQALFLKATDKKLNIF